MTTRWYYKSGETVFGPISRDGLHRLIAGGQIGVHTLVSPAQQGDWVRAEEVEGLVGGVESDSPAAERPEQPDIPSHSQPPPLPKPTILHADVVADPDEDERVEGPQTAAEAIPSKPPLASVPEPLRPEDVSLVLSETRRPRRWLAALVPFFVSMLFHEALLIALGLGVISRIGQGAYNSISLNATRGSLDDGLEEDEFLEVDTPPTDWAKLDVEPVDLLDRIFELPEESVDLALAPDPAIDADRPFGLQGRIRREDLNRRIGRGQSGAEAAASRVHRAASVEQAVGGIVGDIRRDLVEGDLLVVWLFDSSISLIDDRKRVAARLESFFEDLGSRESQDSHKLMSAAAAFGESTHQLVAPTELTGRIVDAVGDVPVDGSGQENVFAAVAWAVNRYGKRWKHGMKIVVWTDESGDDIEALDRTVATCRQRSASVSVVGPTAILGRQDAVHVWSHAGTGRVFYLPTKRGPDSALPERLRLPYWYDTPMPGLDDYPAGIAAGLAPRRGRLPAWYGGPQLEMLASGFGPYALTRLALETGGTYTIFDRAADRGPFQLDVMRPYLPDYRSPQEVLEEIRDRPLRQAVLSAATLTLRESSLGPPETHFFGRQPRYLAPAEFRNSLKDALEREQLLANRLLQTTWQGLAHFGPDGMESLYEEEDSARWRAWYDLTRGRLLAIRVRAMEHAQACRLLLPGLKLSTNHVTFEPWTELRLGSMTEPLADEAERLLRRCIKANAGTPWAYLARRELEYPFGTSARQIVVPRPPPQPAAPRGPAMPVPVRPSITPPSL